MDAVLILRRQIKNPTPSIDAYLQLEQPSQIFYPDPISNDAALGFLKRLSQQEEQQDE